jgi:hypothetical protein
MIDQTRRGLTVNALWLGTPVALDPGTLAHGPYPAEPLPNA